MCKESNGESKSWTGTSYSLWWERSKVPIPNQRMLQYMLTMYADICGHEIILKTGFGLYKGLHWTPCSFLTAQTGLWMMQSTWNCISSCSIWTDQGQTAFNTNIPDTLQNKLTQLSAPTSVCQWITGFLTDRQQVVRLGKFSSSTHTISTGAPQGCVLSPLLFSLYTNDCTSKDPSVELLKFADDTTLIDLIQDGDESAHKQEVKELAVWCSLNNLELITLKTGIVDFRRNPPALPPLTMNSMNSTVTAVESFRFLGTSIYQDLKQGRGQTFLSGWAFIK